MNIGFIGLGAMGVPMAARLVQAGHRVQGYDIRPGAAQAWARDAGAQAVAAASPADAARGADVVWLMVVTGEQAAQVLFESGVAAAATPGAIVVAACTQAPRMAAQLAERVRAAGLRFVDAPVSGGVVGAKAGTLTVMAAGATADLDALGPVFDAVAGRVFRVGDEAGQGSTAKMINQLLCGVHIAAAAEAMHLAERSGVSTKTMHEIIGVSAGNSWMWGDRGPRMMQDDPKVTSADDIFVKDLGIVLDQGKALGAGLPLSSAAMQMFLAASGLGHGAADDSQVIRAYRALNGSGKKIKK